MPRYSVPIYFEIEADNDIEAGNKVWERLCPPSHQCIEGDDKCLFDFAEIGEAEEILDK